MLSDHSLIIFAVVAIVVVVFLQAAIWASRYARVGPNQVLIVSGRRIQLPDGTFRGYRLVKGGGTFVIPVVEKADVLSLEVMSIEMPRASLPAADGRAIEVECRAQVKINGDDRSIVAAVEHFLTKSQNEIKDIIRPVLEKHLAKALRNLNGAEAARNPAEVAAEVLNAASADLASMGMSIISFTIRTARVV